MNNNSNTVRIFYIEVQSTSLEFNNNSKYSYSFYLISCNKKLDIDSNELNFGIDKTFEKYLIITNNLNQSQKEFNEIFYIIKNIDKTNLKNSSRSFFILIIIIIFKY